MSEYVNHPNCGHPQVACPEAGLNCEGCVTHTASELAQVCKGLRGKMVAQLFVQLYPGPECSRMHAHFTAAYKEASRIAASPIAPGDVSEVIPRRGPQPEWLAERHALVAVA